MYVPTSETFDTYRMSCTVCLLFEDLTSACSTVYQRWFVITFAKCVGASGILVQRAMYDVLLMSFGCPSLSHFLPMRRSLAITMKALSGNGAWSDLWAGEHKGRVRCLVWLWGIERGRGGTGVKYASTEGEITRYMWSFA
jgi:hypothetical protein